MNPFATLAKSTRTLRLLETQKANPSQALGGIYIPEGHHVAAPVGKITPDELMLNGYKRNVYAYTCVDRSATMASRAYWKVERRIGKTDRWEPDPNDWRNAVLAYPMGDKMSAEEVNYYFCAWLQICGNGLFRKILGGANGVIGYMPMTPKNLEAVPDRMEWISGYNLIEDGKIIWNYPAEEIIHGRFPDPENPLWGFGPMMAAWRAIQSDNASADWRTKVKASGGVPPVAIIDAQLTPNQAAEQHAALRVAFRRNAMDGTPMLLGGEKQVVEFGFSPSDLEMPDDREMTKADICNAFGVHPSVVSNDSATYDNMDAGIRYTYENGVLKVLCAQREALNLGLLTQEEIESDSVYINFDLSQIPFFRRQREAKIAAMGTALSSGISRDDYVVMADLGLQPAKEGGDALFVQSGLVLLSEAAMGMTSTAAASFNADPMGSSAPPADLGAALPQEQDVQVTQDAVLNGAQITAATAIVQAVAVGDLPRDAGIGQLMVLFNLEQSQAELMMGTAGNGFVAQSTVAPPPTVPSVQPPAE